MFIDTQHDVYLAPEYYYFTFSTVTFFFQIVCFQLFLPILSPRSEIKASLWLEQVSNTDQSKVHTQPRSGNYDETYGERKTENRFWRKKKKFLLLFWIELGFFKPHNTVKNLHKHFNAVNFSSSATDGRYWHAGDPILGALMGSTHPETKAAWRYKTSSYWATHEAEIPFDVLTFNVAPLCSLLKGILKGITWDCLPHHVTGKKSLPQLDLELLQTPSVSLLLA